MDIKTLQVGPIGTNCYILCDETEKVCAVIDPGEEANRIAAAVKATGCTPCAVFLTHGHYDHTGAAEALSALWPETPVYLSRKDQYPGDGYLCQLFPVIANAKDYGEGDTFTVGSLEVKVLSTPGHSEGSVSLLCGDVLFSGAAKPDLAIPLYEDFMAHCRERGFTVAHGEFGADMQVASVNDGPVTILYDTER